MGGDGLGDELVELVETEMGMAWIVTGRKDAA
jgi:hypothetical protein